jgi:hypothetical protein
MRGHHSALSASVAVRAWTIDFFEPIWMTARGSRRRLEYQSGCVDRPPHEAITTSTSPSWRNSSGTVCGRPVEAPRVVSRSMSFRTRRRPMTPPVSRYARTCSRDNRRAVVSRIGANLDLSGATGLPRVDDQRIERAMAGLGRDRPGARMPLGGWQCRFPRVVHGANGPTPADSSAASRPSGTIFCRGCPSRFGGRR